VGHSFILRGSAKPVDDCYKARGQLRLLEEGFAGKQTIERLQPLSLDTTPANRKTWL
jgi:hypothetical protein